MNVLEFDSVFLDFGFHRILSDVYMKCETGKITGLLGRNGSGKSCLMKSVFGTLPTEHKSVRINKKPLIGNYIKDRLISYLPQDRLIPEFLTLERAAAMYHVSTDKIVAEFPELAGLLRLRPGQVSGGQLRLFEVLLILFTVHPFCILDEPFSGIMPVHIESLEIILLREKKHKGIVITDHLHRYVRQLADVLYVLADGKTHTVNDEDQLIRWGYLGSLL